MDGRSGLEAGRRALIEEFGPDVEIAGAGVVGRVMDGVVLRERGGRGCRWDGPQPGVVRMGVDDGGEMRIRVSGRGSLLRKGTKGGTMRKGERGGVGK